jgi:hypothetical protein
MTKPTHPVDLLACAIATQEGFFLGFTIPEVRNNPGDLDYAGQIGAVRAAPGSVEPLLALFETLPLGVAALYRQLWLQVAQGQTVRQIINQWAPASAGNDTSAYLTNILKWTGLSADTPVLELLPPLQKLN